jgi:hypothetical protein
MSRLSSYPIDQILTVAADGNFLSLRLLDNTLRT